MYKVFVKNCPIILTDNKKISTILEKLPFNNVDILQLVEAIFQNKQKGVCLICTDLKKNWNEFATLFKVQKAAGGKVLNSKNEVLFIYRFGKWDLPKGKLEKGETIANCAIREVEEECGITHLEIVEKLQTTYHIFKKREMPILKITYWYLMHTTYNGKLVPQLEEGIEQAVFKNEEEAQQALTNTYENIKLLF